MARFLFHGTLSPRRAHTQAFFGSGIQIADDQAGHVSAINDSTLYWPFFFWKYALRSASINRASTNPGGLP